MRTNEITGDSYSLKALFGGDTTYTIDYYQREYAWSEDLGPEKQAGSGAHRGAVLLSLR
jgi:hypothetical protein